MKAATRIVHEKSGVELTAIKLRKLVNSGYNACMRERFDKDDEDDGDCDGYAREETFNESAPEEGYEY